MHLLQLLVVLFFSVSSALAAYVDLDSFDDGTYAWNNYFKDQEKPTPQTHSAYAKAAYDEMVADAVARGISEIPSTMSVSFWAKSGSTKGTLIFHSSIKGGRQSSDTTAYINSCNLGSHRYRGMCAEIGSIVFRNTIRSIDTNNRVTWTVYGISNPMTGATDWILPCSDTDAGTGCSSYVRQLANQAGGGGHCIAKREPEPEAMPEPAKGKAPKGKPNTTPKASPKPSPKPTPKQSSVKSSPAKPSSVKQSSASPAKPSSTSTAKPTSINTTLATSVRSSSTASACALPTGKPAKPAKNKLPAPPKIGKAPKPTIKASDLPAISGTPKATLTPTPKATPKA